MAHEPEPVFYKLSELSEMLGVENSVLRFWEKEFPQIRPMKVGPRKRLYRRKDLEAFEEIKRLLYEERFTIVGAKKRLSRADSRQRDLFDEEDKVGACLEAREGEELAEDRYRAARAIIDQTRLALLELRAFLAAGRPAEGPPPDFTLPGPLTASRRPLQSPARAGRPVSEKAAPEKTAPAKATAARKAPAKKKKEPEPPA